MQIKYKTNIPQHYTHLDKASSTLNKQGTISGRDGYEFKGVYEKKCKNRLSLAIRTLANTFFSIGLSIGCSKKAKENWQKVKENWQSVFTGKTKLIVFTKTPQQSNQSVPSAIEKTQTIPAVISLKNEEIKPPSTQENPLPQEKQASDLKQEKDNPNLNQNQDQIPAPQIEIPAPNLSSAGTPKETLIPPSKIEGKVLSQEELERKWTKPELEYFLNNCAEKNKNQNGNLVLGDVVFSVNNQQIRWTQSLKNYLLANLPTETIEVGTEKKLVIKSSLEQLLASQKMIFMEEENGQTEECVCYGFEREILIKNSPYFEALWNGSFKEASRTIKGISAETFKNMLCVIHSVNSKYLVVSFEKFDINQWIALLQFADAFEFNKNTKEIICQKIEQFFLDPEKKSFVNADMETCVHVYQLVTKEYESYEKISLREEIASRLDLELKQKTKTERVEYFKSLEENYGVALLLDLFGIRGLDRKYLWELDISWLIKLYLTPNLDSGGLKIDINNEFDRLLSSQVDENKYVELVNGFIKDNGMSFLVGFFSRGKLNINYLTESQMTSIYNSYKLEKEKLSIDADEFSWANGKTKEEKIKNLTCRLIANYFKTAFNSHDIPKKFHELVQALNKFEKVFPDINLQNYKASLGPYGNNSHFLTIFLSAKEALRVLDSTGENKLQKISELMKNLNPFAESPDHAVFGKTLAAHVKQEDLAVSLNVTKSRQRMTIGFLEEILASNNKDRIQAVFREYLRNFEFNPQELSESLRLKDPYAMSDGGCLVILEKIDTPEKLKWILEVVPSEPAELKQEILKKFKTWHYYFDFGTDRFYKVPLADAEKCKVFQEVGLV